MLTGARASWTRAGSPAAATCGSASSTRPATCRRGRCATSSCRRRVRRRARVGRRPAVRSVLAALAATGIGPGRPGRADVRRRAPPGRAGRAADPARTTCWCSTSRPTTWTSRASRWLAGYLRSTPAALVVVTHDRWFLDEVCTTDLGGRRRAGARLRRRLLGLRAGPGRAGPDRRRPPSERRLQPAAQGAGLAAPRAARPDQQAASSGSRRPHALIADEPPPRDGVELTRLATARLGKTVIDAERRRPSRPGPRILLDDVTWRLGPGDRVGVVGVNGSGKTTLLRAAAPARTSRARGGPRVGRSARPVAPAVPVAGYVHRAARRTRLRALGGGRRRSRRIAPDRQPGDLGVQPAARAARAARPTGSGRPSASCPAASGGGCSCCGC